MKETRIAYLLHFATVTHLAQDVVTHFVQTSRFSAFGKTSPETRVQMPDTSRPIKDVIRLQRAHWLFRTAQPSWPVWTPPNISPSRCARFENNLLNGLLLRSFSEHCCVPDGTGKENRCISGANRSNWKWFLSTQLAPDQYSLSDELIASLAVRPVSLLLLWIEKSTR